MRTPIIAGNWKMYKTVAEAAAFAGELAPRLAPYTGVERVVCPSFVALAAVANTLEGTGIKVGAQNVHWEAQGAYTSQVSPTMLQGVVEYVIIGHSESRQYLCETDEIVNKKVKAALAHGLKPIVAVGESLDQNERGETQAFVGGQVALEAAAILTEQTIPSSEPADNRANTVKRRARLGHVAVEHPGSTHRRVDREQQRRRVQSGRYRCGLAEHGYFAPCSNSVTKATRLKPADDSRPITRIMVP